MDIEHERITEEQAAEKARTLREELRRKEEEELRHREQVERLQMIEEERRQEEQARREEDARLDALRASEIEKARVLAEGEARRRLVAQSHDHEQRMALIQRDASKRRLQRGVVGLLVASSLLAVGAGVWFHGVKAQATRDRLLSEERAEAARMARDREMQRLQQQIDRAARSDRDEVARLKRQLEELRRQANAQAKSGQSAPLPKREKGGGKELPPPPPPPCADGDPMCERLGR